MEVMTGPGRLIQSDRERSKQGSIVVVDLRWAYPVRQRSVWIRGRCRLAHILVLRRVIRGLG